MHELQTTASRGRSKTFLRGNLGPPGHKICLHPKAFLLGNGKVGPLVCLTACEKQVPVMKSLGVVHLVFVTNPNDDMVVNVNALANRSTGHRFPVSEGLMCQQSAALLDDRKPNPISVPSAPAIFLSLISGDYPPEKIRLIREAGHLRQ